MWQALMDWLPDIRVGSIEIRDLLNLLVAGLAAYLAYLAIRLGREQAAIQQKQDEIMQAEIAERTRVSVWSFFEDVPPGHFGLSIWGWSVAPIRILSWKLIARVEDVEEFTVTDLATGTVLKTEPYVGPFMPPPPTFYNWQVVGTTAIEIKPGGNNYKQFAVCKLVRPAALAEKDMTISYELTTKYRKYFGHGKDAIKVKLPRPTTAT